MIAELIAAEKLPGRHSFSDTGARSHRVSTIVFCKSLYTLPLSRGSQSQPSRSIEMQLIRASHKPDTASRQPTETFTGTVHMDPICLSFLHK